MFSVLKSFKLPVGFEGQEFNNSLKPPHRNVIHVKSMKPVYYFFSAPMKFIDRHVLYSDVKEFKQHETSCFYTKLDFELSSGCRRTHLKPGVTSDTFWRQN